jgi:hypothetical protein
LTAAVAGSLLATGAGVSSASAAVTGQTTIPAADTVGGYSAIETWGSDGLTLKDQYAESGEVSFWRGGHILSDSYTRSNGYTDFSVQIDANASSGFSIAEDDGLVKTLPLGSGADRDFGPAASYSANTPLGMLTEKRSSGESSLELRKTDGSVVSSQVLPSRIYLGEARSIDSNQIVFWGADFVGVLDATTGTITATYTPASGDLGLLQVAGARLSWREITDSGERVCTSGGDLQPTCGPDLGESSYVHYLSTSQYIYRSAGSYFLSTDGSDGVLADHLTSCVSGSYLACQDVDRTGYFKVNADGSLGDKVATFVSRPGVNTMVSLAYGRVYGVDDRGIWTRTTSETDGAAAFGADELLAQSERATSVVASAGRAVDANSTLYFRGQIDPSSASPQISGLTHEISGPYVSYGPLPRNRGTITTISSVDGKQAVATNEFSDSPESSPRILAHFGTRVLLTQEGSSDTEIRDLREPGVVVATLAGATGQGLWGDSVYWVTVTGKYGERTTVLNEWNYQTGRQRTLTLDSSIGACGASLDAVADGTAALSGGCDGPQDIVVNTENMTDIELLPNSSGYVHSLNGNQVAFDSVSGVDVATLPFGGTSAPRLLGVIESGELTGSESWSIDVDLSKPANAGQLTITAADGSTVATIPTPASPDGSIHGLVWDGAGAAPGSYSWALEVADADGQAAVDVAGKGPITGTVVVEAGAPLSFIDVPVGTQFYDEIMWLANEGVTTGWVLSNGDREFRPVQPVARDAMAAFLYRLAGSPAYEAPEASPFTDVPVDSQFYKEISWLAETGISTGWDMGDGTKQFRPLDSVARDAMAAFLYRYADVVLNEDVAGFETPGASPFVDVPVDSLYFRQIAWLADRGVSTGWVNDDGTAEFRDLEPVNRDAMAAFMYRLVNG